MLELLCNVILTQENWSVSFPDPVKAHANVIAFSVDDGKFTSNRLPSKSTHSFFDLTNAVDGDVLLSHVEDFKVVVHSLQEKITSFGYFQDEKSMMAIFEWKSVVQ
jgi:hypothetical protein